MRKLSDSPAELARYKKKVRKNIKKAKASENEVWTDNMALAKHIRIEGQRKHAESGYTTHNEYYKSNKLAEAIEREEKRVIQYPDYLNVRESGVKADEIGEELVNKVMKDLGYKGKYKHPTLERDKAKLAQQKAQESKGATIAAKMEVEVKDKNLSQLKKDYGIEKGMVKVRMKKDNGWKDEQAEGLIVGKLAVITDKRKKFDGLQITHTDTGMGTGIPKYTNQTNALKAAVVMNTVGNWDFGSTEVDSEQTKRGIAALNSPMAGARQIIHNLSAGTETTRY